MSSFFKGTRWRISAICQPTSVLCSDRLRKSDYSCGLFGHMCGYYRGFVYWVRKIYFEYFWRLSIFSSTFLKVQPHFFLDVVLCSVQQYLCMLPLHQSMVTRVAVFMPKWEGKTGSGMMLKRFSYDIECPLSNNITIKKSFQIQVNNKNLWDLKMQNVAMFCFLSGR